MVDFISNRNFADWRVNYRFNGGTWHPFTLTPDELALAGERSGSYSFTVPVDVAELPTGPTPSSSPAPGSIGVQPHIANIDLVGDGDGPPLPPPPPSSTTTTTTSTTTTVAPTTTSSSTTTVAPTTTSSSTTTTSAPTTTTTTTTVRRRLRRVGRSWRSSRRRRGLTGSSSRSTRAAWRLANRCRCCRPGRVSTTWPVRDPTAIARSMAAVSGDPVGELMWWCAPGGPNTGHMMTSADTRVAVLSPRRARSSTTWAGSAGT